MTSEKESKMRVHVPYKSLLMGALVLLGVVVIYYFNIRPVDRQDAWAKKDDIRWLHTILDANKERLQGRLNQRPQDEGRLNKVRDWVERGRNVQQRQPFYGFRDTAYNTILNQQPQRQAFPDFGDNYFSESDYASSDTTPNQNDGVYPRNDKYLNNGKGTENPDRRIPSRGNYNWEPVEESVQIDRKKPEPDLDSESQLFDQMMSSSSSSSTSESQSTDSLTETVQSETGSKTANPNEDIQRFLNVHPKDRQFEVKKNGMHLLNGEPPSAGESKQELHNVMANAFTAIHERLPASEEKGNKMTYDFQNELVGLPHKTESERKGEYVLQPSVDNNVLLDHDTLGNTKTEKPVQQNIPRPIVGSLQNADTERKHVLQPLPNHDFGLNKEAVINQESGTNVEQNSHLNDIQNTTNQLNDIHQNVAAAKMVPPNIIQNAEAERKAVLQHLPNKDFRLDKEVVINEENGANVEQNRYLHGIQNIPNQRNGTHQIIAAAKTAPTNVNPLPHIVKPSNDTGPITAPKLAIPENKDKNIDPYQDVPEEYLVIRKKVEAEQKQSLLLQHLSQNFPTFQKSNEAINSKKSTPKELTLVDWNSNVYSGTGNVSECVPIQTISSVVRICIHSPREDPEISGVIKFHGHWEPELMRDMLSILSSASNMGLIDIGAGIGTYSLAAASVGKQVVAVEPYSPNIGVFRHSVIINGLRDSIQLFKNVVSDSYAKVIVSRSPVGNTNDIFIENVAAPGDIAGRDIVATVPLNVIAEVCPFTTAVLKIDIPSGYGYRALKASEELFRRINITHVFMRWDTTDSALRDLAVQMLVDRGFRPYRRLDDERMLNVVEAHIWTVKHVIWKKVINVVV